MMLILKVITRQEEIEVKLLYYIINERNAVFKESDIIKRNCNNCKALQKCVSCSGSECKLGYKIEVTEEYDGIPITYKPVEECPKPKTFYEYAEYLSWDRFSNIK